MRFAGIKELKHRRKHVGSGLGLSVSVSCRCCDCGVAQTVYETI
jgi:hypothetical protein